MKTPGSPRLDGLADMPAGEGGGECHVSTGQRFADTHDIWLDARMFTGEQLAGAAESGGDFVQDQ